MFSEHLEGKIRKNVLLLGDIVEDNFMVSKEQRENTISVGFLNDLQKNGHLEDHYLDHFDVLVTNDGPLSVPLNILY